MDSRFAETKGFQWGDFSVDGMSLRCGTADPQGTPVARAVFLEGFREPLEKWFEAMNEKLAQGVQVFAFDWPGQGYSRFLPQTPMKSHHRGQEICVEALDVFMRKHVGASSVPTFVIGQSMGGHLTLRTAQDRGLDAHLALSAPMLMFNAGLPLPLARAAAHLARATGKLESYVPFGQDWREGQDVFDGNPKTSDPARFRVQPDLYRDNPKLRMGDATMGWVYENLKSCDRVNHEDRLRAVQNDILMGLCCDDSIVVNSYAERASRLLPHCERVDIPGAKHEIWMECDPIRDVWRKSLDSFMQKRMKGAALWTPAP